MGHQDHYLLKKVLASLILNKKVLILHNQQDLIIQFTAYQRETPQNYPKISLKNFKIRFLERIKIWIIQ